MMENTKYCNRAKLIGKIEEPFKYGYEIDNKVFYISTLLVKRTSGTYDRVPLCITEKKLQEMPADIYNAKVYIEGFVISYRNVYGNLKMKIRINQMFAREEYVEDMNVISLTADLTNNPSVRSTPMGRELADLGLIIHAGNWMKFYVPAICWGWIANMVKDLNRGAKLSIKARFQSREYEKKNEDGTVTKNEAVELSVYRCYKM